MKTIHMFVYNNINTDARVQRCVNTLSTEYSCLLYSLDQEWDNSNIANETLIPKGRNNFVQYLNVLHQFMKLTAKKKCDIFYAHDFSSAPEAIYMKLSRKCGKLVYDAHELFYPEENVHFSLRDYLFYFCEKWVIKHADVIICAQSDRARIMKEHYKLPQLPVVVRNISILPPCSHMQDKKLEKELLEYFDNNCITVVYAGAIEKERNIEAMIGAVKEYKELPIRILLIGNGSYLGRLKELVDSESMENVKFMPGIPYDQLSFVLSRCDIGYLSYTEERANTRYCSPNKIYEYASVNLPIISTGNETVKALIQSFDIGVYSDNLSKALDLLIPRLEEVRSHCDDFLKSNSWDSEKIKLTEAVKTLRD